MRVAFAGTPPFAARALAAIHAAGYTIPLVLTRPDRPAGRGLRLSESAVGGWGREHGLRVAKPASLRLPEASSLLREIAPDILVVAAYGLILPGEVLEIPRLGCINIHASLLPRWRGAAPVQRAILAGDPVTGISIMQMDQGLDTGPLLLSREIPIDARETSGSLTEKLAALGAVAVVDALRSHDHLVPQPQDGTLATYARKISKSEALIDWRDSGVAVDRKVRAMNPSPGAETSFRGAILKIWEARPVGLQGAAGEVVATSREGFIVACGSGGLEVLSVQKPGGRRMRANEFISGAPAVTGAVLGIPGSKASTPGQIS